MAQKKPWKERLKALIAKYVENKKKREEEKKKPKPEPVTGGGSTGDPNKTYTFSASRIKYEVSDNPDHQGLCFIKPQSSLRGTIKSITIGNEEYKYGRIWYDSELWYGKPAEGIIRIVSSKGIYVSNEPVKDPTKVTPGTPAGKKFYLDYYKLTNGDRPTYYTRDGNNLLKVGQTATITAGSWRKSGKVRVRHNGTIGWHEGSLVCKNSDVPSRGVAVLFPKNFTHHKGLSKEELYLTIE